MKRIVKNLDKLRTAAQPVKFITDEGVDKNFGLETVSAIKEVLEKKPDLIALSAPQIGIDARIFCIKFNDTIKTFINPIITKKNNPKFICEEFASAPEKQVLLVRPTEVDVKYYNDEFKYEDNRLLGTAACLFDQQYQILDGVLPVDIGLVSDKEEDGLITEEDMEHSEEAYKIYCEFVKSLAQEAKADIESDEFMAKQFRGLSATESVINGRITVANPELDDFQKTVNKVVKRTVAQEIAARKAQNKAEMTAYMSKHGKR